jgi:hypothetical protein
MNLPLSKPLIENVFLKDINPEALFLDLNSKNFSGYTYLVVKSDYGFQESIIIFSKGQIVGSIYLNDFYNLEIYGKDAFDLSINCFGVDDGLLNIYNLDSDQIKLLLIFSDKINYNFKIKKSSVSKLSFKYNDNKLKTFINENIDKEKLLKKDLFNKYELSELLRG